VLKDGTQLLKEGSEMAKSKVILEVNGMTCEHCKKTVTETLEGIAGVKKAKVNLKRKQAKVTYDADQTAISLLTEAIKEAGYEAREAT